MPEQYGFRPKHSTVLQLLRVVETIWHGRTNSQHVAGLFLDIHRAFDAIWHSGLLYKLIEFNLPSSYIHFIRSYLKNRSFSVSYNKTSSTARPIAAGVPEGSKLAPLLFNLYINGIPKTHYTKIALFADDTAVIARHGNIRWLRHYIQKHVNLIEDWFDKWRIKINPAKSVLVLFSNRRSLPPPITLNGQFVHFQREVKYLGIHLDSHLTWQKHISYAISKFNKAKKDLAHLLYARNLSISNKILLFKTVLRPILLYAAPVWGSAAKTHIKKLQVQQNRLLRAISHADWYVRNTTIHRNLKIKSITQEIKNLFNSTYNTALDISDEFIDLLDYDRFHFSHRPCAITTRPDFV